MTMVEGATAKAGRKNRRAIPAQCGGEKPWIRVKTTKTRTTVAAGTALKTTPATRNGIGQYPHRRTPTSTTGDRARRCRRTPGAHG